MSNTAVKDMPLAGKLQELIASGVIKPAMMPTAQDFPSARVVVPVYDSTGAGSLPRWIGDNGGRLASNT